MFGKKKEIKLTACDLEMNNYKQKQSALIKSITNTCNFLRRKMAMLPVLQNKYYDKTVKDIAGAKNKLQIQLQAGEDLEREIQAYYAEHKDQITKYNGITKTDYLTVVEIEMGRK